MIYLTCDENGLTVQNNGLAKCETGWVAQPLPDAPTGTGSIDYMSSGQYFGVAFTVASVIVLSAKVTARLLNFIRR